MSVIIGRALPDVRDGLKPAHRRVLYAMRQMGLASNRPYRKCAKVIGEVIGNYHPHGDAPAYDTLVRLAQDFNMRYRPGRRPGQLRLGRRRPARGLPLHGSASRGAGRRDDGGSRQGNRRLRPELRRDDRRTDGPADDLPEPAGQRLRGHRRRHGHEHPAAQHAGSHRRRDRPDRASRPAAGGSPQGRPQDDSRSRFPDRRLHRRAPGHLQRLHDRPRLDHAAREGDDRGVARRGTRSPSSSPRSHTRSTRSGCSRTSPSSSARRSSRASPISATNRTATACGS